MMHRPLPIEKIHFQDLIPHEGSMVLIDQVDDWDLNKISCSSRSHLLSNNPLIVNNSLSAMHLIEYGAQAMAIHRGLLTGKSLQGFLAAVRDANFYIDNLDNVHGALNIQAIFELKINNNVVYSLNVSDEHGTLLLKARTSVVHA
jgi:predicted hotdog family 3-hydroxylacyl-ACP dehydratase